MSATEGTTPLLSTDEVWFFHSASGRRFTEKNLVETHYAALEAQYGPPRDLDDYNRKSQAMAYDSERAMFEAYSRNKYTSTGIIHWMLNNAWPSLIWHLYDYYLRPAGGYFGTKKANEPVHIMYSYDDHSIAVVNSTYKRLTGLKSSIRVLDFNLRELFSQEKAIDVDCDSVQKKVLQIPDLPSGGKPTVYFIQLNLKDATGILLSSNFYWLSTKKPEFDWGKNGEKRSTPVTSYEDMTRLMKLPRINLKVTAHLRPAKDGESVQVRLENTSTELAFQVRLSIEEGKRGEEILPVLWKDNYVSLLPREERTVEAHFPGKRSIGSEATLKISGWNIISQTLVIGKTTANTPDAKERLD